MAVFTFWPTCIWESFLSFIPSQLVSLVIMITKTLVVLYYPMILLIMFLYIFNICIYIYKYIGNLPSDCYNKLWDKPRQMIARTVNFLGCIWHGYEICGLENLPEGPAVIVYYHGGLPLDYYLFIKQLYTLTGRLCHSVVDNAICNFTGLKMYCFVFGFGNLTKNECVNLLKEGHLLGIAPGGLREQNYSNKYYKLVWQKRIGFAKVAKDAKVPIVPMFTQNIREANNTYGNIAPLRWLYEKTRIIFFPVYGLFPVKLRTHIGKPIPYDPDITAEELAEKTKMAIEALRDKHQRIPGSILKAICERFQKHHKDK